MKSGSGAALRERKKPLLVGGIAAALMSAAAVSLVPSASADPRTDRAERSAQTTSTPFAPSGARPGIPSPRQKTTSESEAADASEAVRESEAVADTPSADGGGPSASHARQIAGDAPDVAARALLAERQRCLGIGSLPCLQRISQPGSAAAAESAELVAASRPDRDEPDFSAYEVTLVDRLGGSALIGLTPPATTPETPAASALLVEGEAGWRIRQLWTE